MKQFEYSPYLTRQEAARYLRVSVMSVDKALAQGILPRVMFGGRVLIHINEIERVLKESVKPAKTINRISNLSHA